MAPSPLRSSCISEIYSGRRLRRNTLSVSEHLLWTCYFPYSNLSQCKVNIIFLYFKIMKTKVCALSVICPLGILSGLRCLHSSHVSHQITFQSTVLKWWRVSGPQNWDPLLDLATAHLPSGSLTENKKVKWVVLFCFIGLPGWLSGKIYIYPSANAGDSRDAGSIPGSKRSPGVGNGNCSGILAWKIP